MASIVDINGNPSEQAANRIREIDLLLDNWQRGCIFGKPPEVGVICLLLYYKCALTEEQIGNLLHITQPAVHAHLIRTGKRIVKSVIKKMDKTRKV